MVMVESQRKLESEFSRLLGDAVSDYSIRLAKMTDLTFCKLLSDSILAG